MVGISSSICESPAFMTACEHSGSLKFIIFELTDNIKLWIWSGFSFSLQKYEHSYSNTIIHLILGSNFIPYAEL